MFNFECGTYLMYYNWRLCDAVQDFAKQGFAGRINADFDDVTCIRTSESAAMAADHEILCNRMLTTMTRDYPHRNTTMTSDSDYEYNVTCVFPVLLSLFPVCSNTYSLCATNKPEYYWTCRDDVTRERSEFNTCNRSSKFVSNGILINVISISIKRVLLVHGRID